jgi:hypothetical protein
MEASALEVHVLPLQPEQLAASKPRIEQCGERGVETWLMFLCDVQQRGSLLRCPRIDGRSLCTHATVHTAHQLTNPCSGIEGHEPVTLKQGQNSAQHRETPVAPKSIC